VTEMSRVRLQATALQVVAVVSCLHATGPVGRDDLNGLQQCQPLCISHGPTVYSPFCLSGQLSLPSLMGW